MKINAKAKLNLSLNIIGQENGYHVLESVVTEIDLCDKIYLKQDSKIKVEYNSRFKIEAEKDNSYKAISYFVKEFGVPPVSAYIKKAIPQKAGLGGSSADAVGIVKGMQKLYGITDKDRVLKILNQIGSDCAVQYSGGYNLMQGRGEKVTKINSNKKLYFLLLCEENGVDTKECFALADSIGSGVVSDNAELIKYLQGEKQDLPKLDNALKKPAEILNPTVKENLEILSKYFDIYNMTGSGSCCYGVTKSYFKAKKVYKILKKQNKKVYLTKN
ncbi:MAG: hypothetical protein J6C97_05115 [Clostridia bacterium]|nr:hypothetical protein [Clostridia bacterium]